MKRGFMDLVATAIILEYPGLTAEEYAREALSSGFELSDSKDPMQSLATTLAKQVREGREPRIRRERVRGKYHYFPTSNPTSTVEVNQSENIVVQLSLIKQELEDIDNLVAVDIFQNRSEAIKWLVSEGIRANRDYLAEVSQKRKQIEQLKAELKRG